MLGTDFVLSSLVKENLDHIFLVPGGLIDPFLPALARHGKLKPIVAAQEGGAAYMADGYARASGKFGAALCIGGPGLANTVTAIAAAKSDGSPVILISGEVPTEIEGLGMFQDASSQTYDDVGLLAKLTKYSSSIDNPKNLHHLWRHAMIYLLSAPTGPVHISIPKDIQLATINASYEPINADIKRANILSITSSKESLKLFLSSQDGKPPIKIVILAGAGVEFSGASEKLKQFAERWQIPVATTLRAKGLFPEDHELSLGVFGYAGTHHSCMAIMDSPPDLLLVLGSGLNERDTMNWTLKLSLKNTICVNLDPLPMATHLNGNSVVADIGAYLEWLDEQSKIIESSLSSTIADRKKWLATIRATPRLQDSENCISSAIPIHPARIIADLRKVYPRDGIVLIDSGAHRAFAGHYWDAYEPGTYISATNLGPMGWAIPAAIGVQCAQPKKRVTVITGDGCMHMEGVEIATAARYQLPIIYVVINNAALGNVWLRAHTEGAVPTELTTLPNIDWASFSRSLGANGITVTDPSELVNAYQSALKNNGPTVIDIKADKKFATPVQDWALASADWSYQE